MDTEHVIQINFDVNEDQLSAAKRTTEDKVRAIESSKTEIQKEGERARGDVAKKAIDTQFQDYDASIKARLLSMQQGLNEERAAIKKLVDDRRELERSVVFDRDSEKQQHADMLLQNQKMLEAKQQANQKNEKEFTSIVQAEEEARKRIRREAMFDPSLDRQLDKQSSMDKMKASTFREDDDIRSVRQSTLGGQMFNMAAGSMKMGSGNEGAVVSSLAGMGTTIAGTMAGLTNPITALVQIAGGIKDIAARAYDMSRQNSADQLKLVGGSAEIARRAVAEAKGGEAGIEYRDDSVGVASRLKNQHDLTEEERGQADAVLKALTDRAPHVEANYLDAAEVGKEVFAAARQLGMKAEDLAKTVGDMARRGGDSTTSGVSDRLKLMEDIGRVATTAAAKDGNFDPQALINQSVKLYEQLQPFGIGMEEAAASTFKWRVELDKGTVNLTQLAETAMGLRKQDTGTRAFVGETMANATAKEADAGGFGLARKLLQDKDQYERASLIRVFAEGANTEFLKTNVKEFSGLSQKALEAKSLELQQGVRAGGQYTFDKTEGPLEAGHTGLGRAAMKQEFMHDPTLSKFIPGVDDRTGADARLKTMAERSNEVGADFSKLRSESQQLAGSFHKVGADLVGSSRSWTTRLGEMVSDAVAGGEPTYKGMAGARTRVRQTEKAKQLQRSSRQRGEATGAGDESTRGGAGGGNGKAGAGGDGGHASLQRIEIQHRFDDQFAKDIAGHLDKVASGNSADWIRQSARDKNDAQATFRQQRDQKVVG